MLAPPHKRCVLCCQGRVEAHLLIDNDQHFPLDVFRDPLDTEVGIPGVLFVGILLYEACHNFEVKDVKSKSI